MKAIYGFSDPPESFTKFSSVVVSVMSASTSSYVPSFVLPDPVLRSICPGRPVSPPRPARAIRPTTRHAP